MDLYPNSAGDVDLLHLPDCPDQLAEIFKYAQLGGCVSGITHEVNNYLGAIMAYSELVSLEPNLSAESTRMLGEIARAARRSASLMGMLMGIARADDPSRSVVNPQDLVAKAIELRGYDIKISQIAVERRVAGTAGNMVIDEPKMVRALLYLLVNAIEQAKATRHLEIVFAIEGTPDSVAFSVRNAGLPIAPEHRESVFDPLYTTKGSTHMGLGLTQAREIARLHAGDLTYDPDRGFVLTVARKAPTA